MYLYTYKDFLAIFLVAVFILLQGIKPHNTFTIILNVFFYLVFSSTMFWALYNIIIRNESHFNLGLIIACAFAIIAKISNPYIKKGVDKYFEKK